MGVYGQLTLLVRRRYTIQSAECTRCLVHLPMNFFNINISYRLHLLEVRDVVIRAELGISPICMYLFT